MNQMLLNVSTRKFRRSVRLEREAPSVVGSILERIDEILTVTRLGLPDELRRSLACTNTIENMMGTIRRVCRNVKRWRLPAMALRWIAAAMLEAKKGFRRLKAHKQLCGTAHRAQGALRETLKQQRPCSESQGRIVSPQQRPLRHSHYYRNDCGGDGGAGGEEAARRDLQASNGRNAHDVFRCTQRRVGEDVAILAPHRPGRADFPHPVPHARASFQVV
jgi:hypothetical protein